MSKRNETPVQPARTPRLIDAGDAKVQTNASGGGDVEEIFPLEPYVGP